MWVEKFDCFMLVICSITRCNLCWMNGLESLDLGEKHIHMYTKIQYPHVHDNHMYTQLTYTHMVYIIHMYTWHCMPIRGYKHQHVRLLPLWIPVSRLSFSVGRLKPIHKRGGMFTYHLETWLVVPSPVNEAWALCYQMINQLCLSIRSRL